MYCLSTLSDLHRVLELKHFDWQVPLSRTLQVLFDVSVALHLFYLTRLSRHCSGSMDASLLFFLICVQHTGRLFACELLFSSL